MQMNLVSHPPAIDSCKNEPVQQNRQPKQPASDMQEGGQYSNYDQQNQRCPDANSEHGCQSKYTRHRNRLCASRQNMVPLHKGQGKGY